MNDGKRNRGQNRDGGTVGKSYNPIAHKSSHPASFLREIGCGANPAGAGRTQNHFQCRERKSGGQLNERAMRVIVLYAVRGAFRKILKNANMTIDWNDYG